MIADNPQILEALQSPSRMNKIDPHDIQKNETLVYRDRGKILK